MPDFKMIIGGEERISTSKDWIDSVNPFTNKIWARIPRGRSEDAIAAVDAAAAAMENPDWANITASQRGALLRKVGDLIRDNAERLADFEVHDHGKLKVEVIGQLGYLSQYYYYYGGLADKIEGSVIPSDKAGMFTHTVYEPLGVVVAITPWNSPLLLATWKLAPALAAGNAVVIKPSEHASVSVIEFAKLFLEAGFPPGSVNVVTGYGNECGAALVEHPKVAKIAFTGGDAVGKAVYQAAAKTLKHVTLELGGKSPNIVCEDADITQAVKGAVSGIFAANGQTCMAGSRLLVHESRHDEFVADLLAFVANAKIGDPMAADTQIGPVSTRPQYKKVLQYVAIATSEGATLAYGGKPYRGTGCENGLFVEPTILTNVTNSMRVAQEEIFGPVLSIIRFKDDDEAIKIANDTPYGLAAGVWTNDLTRAFRYTKSLNAGTVWVNAYRVVSYAVPFGGFKQSGIGRENGQEMIKEYLQTKSVYINLEKDGPNPFVLR